jgi:hypothetical protein
LEYAYVIALGRMGSDTRLDLTKLRNNIQKKRPGFILKLKLKFCHGNYRKLLGTVLHQAKSFAESDYQVIGSRKMGFTRSKYF